MGVIVNSIIFLITRTLKNKFKNMLRKPSMVILYLFFILFFGYSIVLTVLNPPALPTSAKPQWLLVFFTVYLMFFYFGGITKGLSSGSSFFEMSDVNLLFGAPVNPKQILGYGILSQAGKSLIGGLFLLLQGTTFASLGLNTIHLFLFFGAYVLALLICEFMSLAIYMITNQHERRKKIVKVIAILPILVLAVSYLRKYLEIGDYKETLFSILEDGSLKLLPIVGWTTEGLRTYLAGNMAGAGFNILLTLLLGIFFIAVIILYNSDYYEDVLVATETSFEKKRALTEGNINAVSKTPKKVNKGNKRLAGIGAQAILYKHLLESSRNNRFSLLDGSSLFMIAGANIAAYFNKESMTMLIILAASFYLQCFLIGTGRGLKELYSHYIYLIPESSFNKIIWSNGEIILKHIIESFLMFLPALIFTNWNPVIALLCAIARSCFSIYLIAANMLSQRIFQNIISQGLLLFIYLLFIMFTMVPGFIALLIAYTANALSVGLILLSLWEIILSVLFFFFSRGVLHASDMPTMQKKN